MITRLARWWLARANRHKVIQVLPTGECICGLVVVGDNLHTVVAVPDNDQALGIGDGAGTGMSADFCPVHCPGGCLRGCASMVA